MKNSFLISCGRTIRFPSFSLVVLPLLFLLSLSFVSASFGFSNPNLPNIPRIESLSVTFNNNTGSVNDTQYWQGYTPQTYNQTFISWIPSWVTNNFLSLNGGTMNGNIDMNGYNVTNASNLCYSDGT